MSKTLNVATQSAKYLLIGLTAIGIAACSGNKAKTVKIEGQKYQINEHGELTVTKDQLEELVNNGEVKHIKHVAKDEPYIISPEELNLLVQDRDMFFSKVYGVEAIGKFSAIVRKGSLKSSVMRIAKEGELEAVKWDVKYDYFVPEAYAMVGDSVESVLVEILAEFPLYFEYDMKTKTVTVTELNH